MIVGDMISLMLQRISSSSSPPQPQVEYSDDTMCVVVPSGRCWLNQAAMRSIPAANMIRSVGTTWCFCFLLDGHQYQTSHITLTYAYFSSSKSSPLTCFILIIIAFTIKKHQHNTMTAVLRVSWLALPQPHPALPRTSSSLPSPS